MTITAEHRRLQEAHDHEHEIHWKQWGPYLSERAWGTVREDYSANGTAWEYLPHDHARSKAYRWGEDGLAGLSDRGQYLCFALALWNGHDPILKERLFGLTGNEGNHGEDVKEYYFYLDNTPTHSYMQMLYKYPQRAYPYVDLIEENRRRGRNDFEYELLDTGIFDDNRYFDVMVEYAKAGAEDVLIRIRATNRGGDAAELTLLPTLWFRNTWSWGYAAGPMKDVSGKPRLYTERAAMITAEHPLLGTVHLYADGSPEIIFTENETNNERLYGTPNASRYTKDAFHRYLINGETAAINPAQTGTKAAAVYKLLIAAGETETLTLRLTAAEQPDPFSGFDALFTERMHEADDFYQALQAEGMTDDQRRVQRQAWAGMLWSKQLYYYDVEQWLAGDPINTPPPERYNGRNHHWQHLNNFDILSMPDKWEYPWYAGWDLAFHCIPLALVDPAFAKAQLLLLTREWYMHPNGQLPAYEWAFSDVNPPVQAWAAWHVYQIDGMQDRVFLKRIFNKMLLNFTWWVNRKDPDGNNVFQGGFLGLDNISLFDRSAALPTGGSINQSDGTAWMGFYCLVMLNIALELAKDDPPYEDMAVKFYEHFLWIAVAISGSARGGMGLWDETDGFFYDVLQLPDGTAHPLKVRSLVGLMPLIAVETVGQETMDRFGNFARSIQWLREHRPHLADNLASVQIPGYGSAHLFAIPKQERLRSVLRYMLDENEFLSPYGLRSISKIHETPYELQVEGQSFSIEYWPAESRGSLFGGNSNWRGPVWFPINYLLIEALWKYHRYYGDDFKVECPTGSGQMMTLKEVANDLAQRLTRIFLRDEGGRRPVFGGIDRFQNDPHWRDYILFHEYFHGDNGAGLGANHQTGWTGLVADLLNREGHFGVW
ncbi:MAG: glucosidase [Anaerolineaceae bacterium]|nr:glucosidase [Anaerolineaceae bacterium]